MNSIFNTNNIGQELLPIANDIEEINKLLITENIIESTFLPKIYVLSSVHGYFDTIKYLHPHLISNKFFDDMLKYSTLYAVENNHTNIAEFLFENGADSNYEYEKISAGFCIRTTILEHAVEKNNLCLVSQLLLKYGALLRKSINALTYAARNGNIEMIQYLLYEGVDINECDSGIFHNESPLIVAAEEGYAEIVNYLIKHGADINRDGEDALARAYLEKRLDVIKVLVGHNVCYAKVDFYVPDPFGSHTDDSIVEVTPEKLLDMFIKHKDFDFIEKKLNSCQDIIKDKMSKQFNKENISFVELICDDQ